MSLGETLDLDFRSAAVALLCHSLVEGVVLNAHFLSWRLQAKLPLLATPKFPAYGCLLPLFSSTCCVVPFFYTLRKAFSL